MTDAVEKLLELEDPPTVLAVAEHLAGALGGASAYRLADVCEAVGGDARVPEEDFDWVVTGLDRLDRDRVDWWRGELSRLGERGISIVTAAQPAYPSNLRMIPNRPPFLFVRGSLLPTDERAMAVVGTRHPGSKGAESAYTIAGELAKRGVTVVSGLAEGIDTHAHTGALDAGGRTLAVFGTGIERIFPARNRPLAERLTENGACVSQFWPGTGGARWTFPIRNIVTSGLSLGTIVVEAGPTSGAKLQAHDAIRHGKRVFLMRELVMAQPWAQEVAEQPGVATLDSVDDVIRAVDVELSSELTLI